MPLARAVTACNHGPERKKARRCARNGVLARFLAPRVEKTSNFGDFCIAPPGSHPLQSKGQDVSNVH
jgi:hypothetical protein